MMIKSEAVVQVKEKSVTMISWEPVHENTLQLIKLINNSGKWIHCEGGTHKFQKMVESHFW